LNFNSREIYSILSNDIYKKNKAMLNAGKTRPTKGTKMEGKNAVAIITFL